MKLMNSVPYFLEKYQPTLAFLESYYNEHPQTFQEYFSFHCKKTDERLHNSLQKYDQCLPHIKQSHETIQRILPEIQERYHQQYNVLFEGTVHLFVGLFGSNAYTHRQYIPDISFAMEQVPLTKEGLSILVAHEFGHAIQNRLTNQTGIEWETVRWESLLLALYREGAATHLSRKIVPEAADHLYLTFSSLGGPEWLQFSEKNQLAIKTSLASDYQTMSTQALFREWYSINGGQRFGQTRLAYYLGDLFFKELLEERGEHEALVVWKDPTFIKEIEQWLLS
ncbi:hypothetical protein JOC54_002602 [Alkalihalobacillus xiaoxiensis]|uniref:DUF2268 domain-containing protein n=1 Tax=Shouchella xiaoxiensis TaxID=766895 RepID=A0ABS2SUZ3_9BACI|nr:hypothetical protein [Shouchella xiaoxiensis]MBM7839331.1 hypothetical protein [Shouchella xiaoxiensis]